MTACEQTHAEVAERKRLEAALDMMLEAALDMMERDRNHNIGFARDAIAERDAAQAALARLDAVTVEEVARIIWAARTAIGGDDPMFATDAAHRLVAMIRARVAGP